MQNRKNPAWDWRRNLIIHAFNQNLIAHSERENIILFAGGKQMFNVLAVDECVPLSYRSPV